MLLLWRQPTVQQKLAVVLSIISHLLPRRISGTHLTPLISTNAALRKGQAWNSYFESVKGEMRISGETSALGFPHSSVMKDLVGVPLTWHLNVKLQLLFYWGWDRAFLNRVQNLHSNWSISNCLGFVENEWCGNSCLGLGLSIVFVISTVFTKSYQVHLYV